MPSLIFCFVFFSFFLRFVSSFEQSNGNCMILFTGFFFFCLLLLLKKWEMYHHIGLPFLKIQIRPLSSYVPNLPSRSISVSFQIGHTKMDFFSLKFKYGQIVSSKTLNHRVRKQQQYFLFVVVVGSTSLVVLDVVALRFSANAACVYLCELIMSACLWLDCVCVPLSRFFLIVTSNRSGECVFFFVFVWGSTKKRKIKNKKTMEKKA